MSASILQLSCCFVRGRRGGLLIPAGPAAWGSRTCHRLITGLTCGGKHAYTLRESTISLRTAGGDPRTHANSSEEGHHISGKRDLVIVRRSPAGSRVLLIARRPTLVAALCMHECSCVCFWSTCLVLIFLDLLIPHLASANFLSWISSLVCEGVCHLSYFQSCFLLLFLLLLRLLCPFIDGYLLVFLFPASRLTTNIQKEEETPLPEQHIH